jgi:putative transposase
MHWAQMFSERECGENIDEFCGRNGISRNQFFYWQRKLREAACTELVLRSGETGIKELPPPSGWALCKADEPPVVNEVKMSVEIGKFSIPVSDDCSPELLKKVCGVLSELC